MYFSAAEMIPTYIWIKQLGLLNNPLVLIIGAGVSCYNLIVTRQYFDTSIPIELYEAAYIDGVLRNLKNFLYNCNYHWQNLVKVMALYFGVGHWNSYYSA